MKAIKTGLHKLRAILWTAVVISTLCLALAVGVLRLLLPYAPGFKPDLERWLAEQTGQSVRIGSMGSDWTEGHAIISLLDVGFSQGDADPLTFERIEISLHPASYLLPGGRYGIDFNVITDQIDIVRDLTGQWRVSGISTVTDADDDGRITDLLTTFGNAGFIANRLQITDQLNDQSVTLDTIEVSVIDQGEVRIIEGRIGESPDDNGIHFSATLTQHEDDSGWGYEAYARIETDSLGEWFRTWTQFGARPLSGDVDLEVWMRGHEDRLHSLQSSLELDNLVIGGNIRLDDDEQSLIATRYQIEHLNTQLAMEFSENGQWQLFFQDFIMERNDKQWPVTDLAVRRVLDSDGVSSYQIGTDFLRIEDLVDSLVVIDGLPQELRRLIYEASPHADLSDIRIASLRIGWPLQITGTLSFDGLSSTPFNYLPGISDISGQVELNDFQGLARLSGQDNFIDLPRILRWPLLMESMSADVLWDWDGEIWNMDVSHLSLKNDNLDSEGRVAVTFDSERPTVDIQLAVNHSNLRQSKLYWPLIGFKPRLVEWLDRSLISGTLNSGQITLYGDLDDWPFADNQGVFHASANLVDTHVDYSQNWPEVRNLNAAVEFFPGGMRLNSSRATTGELDIVDIQLYLPDHRRKIIELTSTGVGDVDEMIRYLQDTPLNERYGQYLSDTNAQGQGRTSVNLKVPFAKGLKLDVDGVVELTDTRFSFNQWDLELTGTNGRLNFDRDSLSSEALSSSFLGETIDINLLMGAAAGDSADVSINVDTLAPLELFSRYLPEHLDLVRIMPDPVRWQASFVKPSRPDGATEPADVMFNLSSDLVGTPINLPSPFAKAPIESRRVTLSTDLPNLESVSLDIDSLLSMKLLQGTPYWRGDVMFGGPVETVTSENGLIIGGVIGALDLDGVWQWVGENFQTQGTEGDGQLIINRMDGQVDSMILMERAFGTTAFEAGREGEFWQIAVDGDWGAGQLRLPLEQTPGLPVLAEFTELNWPDKMPGSTLDYSDPSRLPPVQFLAEHMIMNSIDFGRVSFATYPTAEGMHVEYYETRSDRFSINARGDWRVSGDDNSSDFEITLTAERLGDLLTSFGYDTISDNGQTILAIDAVWPGAPGDFLPETLDGQLTVSVSDGSITTFESGAGKLFGLLNILPRRLFLDFSDVFEKGLAFDRIDGKIAMADGKAITESLLIDGPTVDIEIRGITDLTELTTDTVIRVTPNVGGTLPIVGAIAGGGPGAAAGMVLQNVIGKPFGKIAETFYQVSGEVGDPLVEKITDREGIEILRQRYDIDKSDSETTGS